MNCKICDAQSMLQFSALVLRKYEVQYFRCTKCGYIQTEEPYWLEEAYQRPINLMDTGILERNISFRNQVAPILFYLCNRSGRFVDYAGGYGLFTRLMRDVGYDYVWTDLHTKNLFAEGFEYRGIASGSIEGVTAFEVFEHFIQPRRELEKMLEISRTLIFSTMIIPENVQKDWWYFGFEHGQHVSFYSMTSLQFLAQKYGLHLSSNGANLHLMTPFHVPSWKISLLFRYYDRGIFAHVKRKMKSKTISDMEQLR